MCYTIETNKKKELELKASYLFFITINAIIKKRGEEDDIM